MVVPKQRFKVGTGQHRTHTRSLLFTRDVGECLIKHTFSMGATAPEPDMARSCPNSYNGSVKEETAKSVQVFANDLNHHGVPSRETHVLLTLSDVKLREHFF